MLIIFLTRQDGSRSKVKVPGIKHATSYLILQNSDISANKTVKILIIIITNLITIRGRLRKL